MYCTCTSYYLVYPHGCTVHVHVLACTQCMVLEGTQCPVQYTYLYNAWAVTVGHLRSTHVHYVQKAMEGDVVMILASCQQEIDTSM